MTWKKLFALFVLPAALARDQGSLICENGSIRTESRGGDIVPCYVVKGSDYCRFEQIGFDSNYIGGRWSAFEETRVTNIYCDSSTSAGLCYRANHKLWVSDSCSSSGYEAVATVVRDGQSRRRYLKQDDKIDFEGKKTKKVSINGEDWILINPEADESD